MREFHNPVEEPDYPHGIITIAIEDNTKLSAADYRDRLYREISTHKKAARRREGRAEKEGGKQASMETRGGGSTLGPQ